VAPSWYVVCVEPARCEPAKVGNRGSPAQRGKLENLHAATLLTRADRTAPKKASFLRCCLLAPPRPFGMREEKEQFFSPGLQVTV
jgi:hypothetical protein